MEEFAVWIQTYRKAVERAFGGRICCLGIQGSRARGEAGPNSDVDMVLILDRLTPEDLEHYRMAVADLPERELLCGFVSGREELAQWTQGELFQFYHDTRPLIGDLEFLRFAAGRSGAAEAVHTGACALYHACAHNFLHGRDPEVLRELYKSAGFTLRAKCYAEKGVYCSAGRELAEALEGEDLSILQTGEALRRGEAVPFDSASGALLSWTGALIRRGS